LTRKTPGTGLYYFDVVAVVLGAMIAAAYVAGVITRQPLSQYGASVASSLFFTALVALGFNRRAAYTQKTPWIVSIFAVAAAVALATDFWQWNTLWQILILGVGASLLVFGLVVRSKAFSDGLSRFDFFKIAAIGFGVVFALAVSEVALRLAVGLLNPETQQMLRADPGNYGVAHPYIGYLHSPNRTIVISGRDFNAGAHVDGLGFRNAWPWPDRADIVVVGDSVAFGYGVEDNEAWPAVLARHDPGTQVIDLALIGGGPQQYQRVYETFGARLRPKLVLVGVFVRNDFWDAQMFDAWEKSGAGGNYLVWRDFGKTERLTISLGHPLASLRSVFSAEIYPLIRRSYLYNLFRALKSANGEMLGSSRTFTFADGKKLELATSDFMAKSELGVPGTPEFRMTVDAFRRLDEEARANGGRALMVFQPGKEEVYLPLLGEQIPDPTLGLRKAFDRLGIDYLDLGPAFRQHAAAGERLFFEVDGHPNPAGYALIAQLVLSHISQNSGQYGVGTPRPQQ
jgi:lysophospholipase L1-like esterase